LRERENSQKDSFIKVKKRKKQNNKKVFYMNKNQQDNNLYPTHTHSQKKIAVIKGQRRILNQAKYKKK